jgi:hypothetical protein
MRMDRLQVYCVESRIDESYPWFPDGSFASRDLAMQLLLALTEEGRQARMLRRTRRTLRGVTFLAQGA